MPTIRDKGFHVVEILAVVEPFSWYLERKFMPLIVSGDNATDFMAVDPDDWVLERRALDPHS